MNVIVLIKQVPDTDNVKIDEKTGTMIREGLDVVMNLFDLHALEVGLSIVERLGGKLTAISMGPPRTVDVLKEAIAMGASDAILLSDRRFAGSDTLATSLVLSRAIERFLEDFDLIIAGEKATDGETGQVGPQVGALLKIPVLTYVSKILDVSEDHIEVERTIEDGVERWKVRLPALLTVSRSASSPRLPTLSGLKKARSKKIDIIGMEKLGMEEDEVGLRGSPTRVVKVYNVKVTRKGEIYEGERVKEGIERVVEILRRFRG